MSDRLVRVKTVQKPALGDITVTFDEPTPLDSTHLLVVLIGMNLSNAITVPAGWQAAPGGGFNTEQTRVYARPGNGSINSILIQGSNTGWVTLLAFEGFVSATALEGVGENEGSSVTQSISNVAAPVGYGVAIALISVNSVGTYNWTPGWAAPFTQNDPSTSRWTTARAEYLGPAILTAAVTREVIVADSRMQLVIYPLTPEAYFTYALGETPVTLALGANEASLVLGDGFG